MIVEQAKKEDLGKILELQKLAFRSQAEIYNDFSIPPLIQTLEEIEKDFQNQTYLKAVTNKKIIGSVRGYEDSNTCYIGRLIIHPDFQNQGYGTKLMAKIESIFKNVERYEIFTGYKDVKNLYLYQKLGYKKFKIEKVNENLFFEYLEKVNEI
ncbi:MAG: GNAT family N-acetyltransferase [Promethearchaeota archaeon]